MEGFRPILIARACPVLSCPRPALSCPPPRSSSFSLFPRREPAPRIPSSALSRRTRTPDPLCFPFSYFYSVPSLPSSCGLVPLLLYSLFYALTVPLCLRLALVLLKLGSLSTVRIRLRTLPWGFTRFIIYHLPIFFFGWCKIHSLTHEHLNSIRPCRGFQPTTSLCDNTSASASTSTSITQHQPR